MSAAALLTGRKVVIKNVDGEEYVAEVVVAGEPETYVFDSADNLHKVEVAATDLIEHVGELPGDWAAGPLTEAFRRVIRAREFIHAETCSRPLAKDPHPSTRCVSGVSPLAVAKALDHLDVHPRDAKTARRIFHDAVCMSMGSRDHSCGSGEHARTQSNTVAALRRFRAQEASA